MTKYAIGLDYGTSSGRAVLVSLDDGREIVDHETIYPHGVINEKLPNFDVKLGVDWALQDPKDYIEVLKESVPAVINKSGVDPSDIIGVGLDFTSCTMLPLDESGEPLMYQQKWRNNPNAWVKLWKHHATNNYANKINKIAEQRGEQFLTQYGGKVSSEWMLPKIWQIIDESPEVYKATDKFVEAMDWIIFKMTGNLVRSSSAAGYKSNWHKREGYPSKSFLKSIDRRLENLIDTKLRGEVLPIGTRAGEITKDMESLTGLKVGTAVAVGNIDAHASMPGIGAVEPGKLVMVMGTSVCHMLLGPKEVKVEGMCGVVEDGIIPGLYGYEAGQPAVGDIFAWYLEQASPMYIKEAAEKDGVTLHQWFIREASKHKPGESGLLALDWWNGNRSVLNDTDLSGVLIGVNLQTKPEEIYRALMESAAFGTRKIIENFENSGLPVSELYACGGLARKNSLLMQIFSDVTNRKIRVAESRQTSALGAAMFGTVAAGTKRGGFNSIVDAAEKMSSVKEGVITPNIENVSIYNKLYQEYMELHNYFGHGKNNVMKRLKTLRL